MSMDKVFIHKMSVEIMPLEKVSRKNIWRQYEMTLDKMSVGERPVDHMVRRQD